MSTPRRWSGPTSRRIWIGGFRSQRLKAEDGKPILAHGGAAFATSLIAANLVDVLHLVLHPVVLGYGLPIFAGLENPVHLKLENVWQSDTGVVAKTYRPA